MAIALKRRGIRQHINFPMDISSYPLEEAKEYIRELAGMGLNFITFHSYPEQWYEYVKNGKQYYAGHYFYTEPHEISPEMPYYESTRNRRFFMIPEHEADMGDEKKQSRLAMHWLAEVMGEAKKCGLEVRMSLELRGGDVTENVAICEQVQRQYPMIDSLELITQECGGWSGVCWKKEDFPEKLQEMFGLSAEGEVRKFMKDGLGQLPVTMEELKCNLDVIETLRRNHFPAGLSCGVYATDPDTLNLTLYVMRKCLPAEVGMAFLPAHGAQAVAENLQKMEFTQEDLNRCTLYSWAEFDGNMYLQQSEIYGLKKCMDVIEEKCGGNVYAMAVNHWRTKENLLTLRYFARCAESGLSVESFLQEFGQAAGMTNPGQFQRAVDALEKASAYARYHLFNIGFCYRNCWMGEGLGYVANWEEKEIREGLELYALARGEFEKVSGGEEFIGFFLNRIGCTILHLSAMEHLSGLKGLWGKADGSGYAGAVEKCCAAAGYFMQAYMKLHCEMPGDRGSVGTIVSYDHAMPVIVEHLRKRMLGIGAEVTKKTEKDEPPSPAIYG